MEALDALHEGLERAWHAHPEVGELDRMALALTLAELVGNVVEHGGATAIWCTLTVDEDALSVVLEDDGAITPRRVTSQMVTDDPLAESGRGMALARHLSQLAYSRDDGLNRWVVVRPRSGG
jgi:serine/threonine-protein kinase RsbW